MDLLSLLEDDSLQGLDINEIKSCFDGLNGVDEDFNNFIEKVDLSSNVVEQYQQHLKDTGQATSAFSSCTKKAGSVIKSFGAGLASMGVNMAIGVAFDFAATAIDNWVHRVERARERTAELFEEFGEMRETLSSHKDIVANSADRYDELSKGVDLTNNKNLSLSTEEYKEFLDINKKLSSSFPGLIKGVDDNGNSILNLGNKGVTAKKQLQDLINTEEDLNNYKVAQGIEEAFKGVYTYIEDANKAQDELNSIKDKTNEDMGVLQSFAENGVELNKDNYMLFKGDITDETRTDYAYKMQSASNQFFDGLDKDRRFELESKGITSSSLFTMETNDSTGAFEFYANLYSLETDEIQSLESLISENVKGLNKTLLDEFSDKQMEMEEKVQAAKYAWADFMPNLVSGMKSKQTFKNLDEESQDNVVKIVENMDYKSANEMMKQSPDPYVYLRENIIGPMSEFTDSEKSNINGNFSELFRLDKNDLTKNNQDAINNLLENIAKILNKDPVEIRTIFGYEVSEDQDSYNNALTEAQKKMNGLDNNDDITTINEDGKKLDSYWAENIKTLDDAAMWNKVTEGITNVTDAIHAYNMEKEKADNTNINQTQTFTQVWDSIGTTGTDESNKLALEEKEKLLQMAEAGKLTEEVISNSSIAETFEEAGISIDEATDKINNMQSSVSQLASMKTGISSISSILSEKNENYSSKETREIGIGPDTLNSMPEDVKANTEEYEHFVKVLGDGKSKMDDCRDAANELATAYVTSNNFLANLTESEKGYYVSTLKQIGVKNAAKIVDDTLTASRQKQEMKTKALAAATQDMGKKTNKATSAFLTNSKATKLAKLELFDLITKEKIFSKNSGLSTNEKVKELNKLAKSYLGVSDAIQISAMFGDPRYYSDEESRQKAIEKKEKEIEETINQLNKKQRKKILGDIEIDENSGGTDKDTGKEKEKKSKQEFDWIEKRLNYITKLANTAQKAISRMLSIGGTKRKTTKAIKEVTKELKTNQKAYSRYTKRANKVNLSEKYEKLVESGKIGGKNDIQNITSDGKLQKRIEKYQTLYEKAQKCKESMQELASTLQELTKSLANIPIEKRDKSIDKLEKSSNLIRAKIDNTSGAADKNALINSEIENMKDNTEAHKTAYKETKSNLNKDAKSAYKSFGKKVKNLKDSYRKKIRSLIKSRKPITDSLLEKVRESGNPALLKQLYQYNFDLDAKNTAKYDYDLASEQNAKSERDANIEQHQNNTDELESSLEALSAKKENARTASDKNNIIDQEMSVTRQIYAEKKEIANLKGDANEVTRLDEELKSKEKQASIDKVNNIKDEHSNKLNAIDREEYELQRRISKKEALGVGKSKKDYEDQISYNNKRKQEYESQKKTLENYLNEQIQLGNIVEDDTDPAYKLLKDTINECDDGIENCTSSNISLSKSIENIKLDNYKSLITLLEKATNIYNRFKSLAEVHGSTLPEDMLYKQINTNDTIIATKTSSNEETKNQLKEHIMNEDVFGLTEEQADKFIDLATYSPELLPEYLKSLGIEDFNEETYKDAFKFITDLQDNLETIAQKQVENENLVDEFFTRRINSINEYLDALKKEKNIKDRTFAIEKAQFELNKAKNNLTKKVWDGRQWVYAADTDAVQSAQEAYDNAQYDELVNVIEDLIEALENSKKDVNLYDDSGKQINPSDEASIKKMLGSVFEKIAQSSPPLAFNIPKTETPDFSNISGNNSMNINKIEFVLPNINDKSSASELTESFVNQLLNLPTYSKQYDWNK